MTDTQTGCKLFRREVLAEVLPALRERRFAFDLEFFAAARAAGYENLCAAPVRLEQRMAGSTVGLHAVFRTLRDMMVIFARLLTTDAYERADNAVDSAFASTVDRIGVKVLTKI